MTASLSRTMALAISSVVLLMTLVLMWFCNLWANKYSPIGNVAKGVAKHESQNTEIATKESLPAESTVKETTAKEHGGKIDPNQKTKDTTLSTLVSFDELVGNVAITDPRRLHTLSIQLNFEIFDEANRAIIEKNSAGIKNIVLEAIRAETLESLSSLSGKLYFKETLVSHVNQYLNFPAVRDLHFASFLLR